VRHHEGPLPTTVEYLKDALAEVGAAPDQVARAEVLHWAGAGDDVTIVVTHPDGSVRTCYRDRGEDHDVLEWPGEASAVAHLARDLQRYDGRTVPDLVVEPMRARAARHREVMRTHGGR
jgi:hypothetical protein